MCPAQRDVQLQCRWPAVSEFLRTHSKSARLLWKASKTLKPEPSTQRPAADCSIRRHRETDKQSITRSFHAQLARYARSHGVKCGTHLLRCCATVDLFRLAAWGCCPDGGFEAVRRVLMNQTNIESPVSKDCPESATSRAAARPAKRSRRKEISRNAAPTKFQPSLLTLFDIV